MLITSDVPRAGSTDLSTKTRPSSIPSSGWDRGGRGSLIEATPELRLRPNPRRGRQSNTPRTAATSLLCTCSASSRHSPKTNPRYRRSKWNGSPIETSATTYRDEDPDVVVVNWTAKPCRLGGSAADVAAANWSRGITIGDERSTVRRLLEHAVHDSLHHVDDVKRGLNALRS